MLKDIVFGVATFALAGVLFVTPVKSEGMIIFQGMIVEPSCELNINSVQCLETGTSSIHHSFAYFSIDNQGLLVGESKRLLGVTKKIDKIDIVRFDRDEYMVTANYF
ncbi:hypothetical protein [Shewanella putrefaciens]|uniref:Uncharacterized protein n=1 Tax=Shewanella putrefaciens (strain CN-32 / ATCC BAA-453) TaxID=319224 RepID=A4Y245_SHEPC|nr:hypothetical protein [Shewanella putrefaciens]QGS47702.1 type 1 fimbrial protein [Shewanella putrefaciens]CAD6365676.1 hypothetical protein SHEWT2_03561 [Shewanella hafniensis]